MLPALDQRTLTRCEELLAQLTQIDSTRCPRAARLPDRAAAWKRGPVGPSGLFIVLMGRLRKLPCHRETVLQIRPWLLISNIRQRACRFPEWSVWLQILKFSLLTFALLKGALSCQVIQYMWLSLTILQGHRTCPGHLRRCEPTQCFVLHASCVLQSLCSMRC